jgi:hypothetical protein
VEPATVLAAVTAAERAWDVLTGALAAPPPDGSRDGVWRIYLTDEVEAGGTAALEGRDPIARFDRGSSFALVDRSLGPGCDLDLALARAVARGSALRAAPATDPGSATAETETLALLATPCADPAANAGAFQTHPERTLVDPSDASFARGASMFIGWLDRRFGSGPGLLVTGLWSLSPTMSPESWWWAPSPTGFDVLRVSLKDALFPGSTFEDAIVRFSVERATMDPPARKAWSVSWPVKPRRLLSPEPVAPTGSSVVVVSHDGAPPGASLHLEAEWEDYGRMRWVAVKVDAAGRAIGEIPMGSRGTRATLTVEQLEDTSQVRIVGVDIGDTEGPFDPGPGEWEPHGWMLTLSAE